MSIPQFESVLVYCSVRTISKKGFSIFFCYCSGQADLLIVFPSIEVVIAGWLHWCSGNISDMENDNVYHYCYSSKNHHSYCRFVINIEIRKCSDCIQYECNECINFVEPV